MKSVFWKPHASPSTPSKTVLNDLSGTMECPELGPGAAEQLREDQKQKSNASAAKPQRLAGCWDTPVLCPQCIMGGV